jgi:hypothetical protein
LFKPQRGKLRRYEFKIDGTYTAVGAKGPFSGKWVQDGKIVTIFMNQKPELPYANITQNPNNSLELRFVRSNDKMEGRRADKW